MVFFSLPPTRSFSFRAIKTDSSFYTGCISDTYSVNHVMIIILYTVVIFNTWGTRKRSHILSIINTVIIIRIDVDRLSLRFLKSYKKNVKKISLSIKYEYYNKLMYLINMFIWLLIVHRNPGTIIMQKLSSYQNVLSIW